MIIEFLEPVKVVTVDIKNATHGSSGPITFTLFDGEENLGSISGLGKLSLIVSNPRYASKYKLTMIPNVVVPNMWCHVNEIHISGKIR